MTQTPLPPNFQVVRDLLHRSGPMDVGLLRAALREQGIVLSAARLDGLPDRYSGSFSRTADGLIAVEQPPTASGTPEVLEPSADGDSDPAWTGMRRASVTVEDVAVVAVHGEEQDAATALVPGTPGLWQGQLADLGDVLAGCPVVLVAAAPDGFPENLGRNLLDLRLLAQLHAPQEPWRGVRALASRLEVAPLPEHEIHVLLECLRTIVGSIDQQDPSWRLARACLVAAGSPMAAVLPALPLPGTATEGLACLEDPLLTPDADQATALGAGDHVRRTFARLQDLAYRPRPAQRAMADAVAGVMDGGGRLAVEAPTGTGKSLAYLTPAIGWASLGRDTVVIATATKVLQQQLRQTAQSLRRQGLLPAPFRQIFGVSNYICTREVARALVNSDAEASPEHWHALAMAVRGLATASSGVWDDVSDGQIRQESRGYAAARDLLRTDAHSCERDVCDFAAECPLLRRLPSGDEASGVILTNHAMVAAWARPPMSERDGEPSAGRMLGRHPVDVVFDEAHDLEDTLTGAWTDAVSWFSLLGLAARVDGQNGLVRDLSRLAKAGVLVPSADLRAAQAAFVERCGELDRAVEDFLHEFGGSGRSTVLLGKMQNWPEYHRLKSAAMETVYALLRLKQQLTAVNAQLAAAKGSSALRSSVLVKTRGLGVALDQAADCLQQIRDLSEPHLHVYQLSEEKVSGQSGKQAFAWRFAGIPVDIGPAFRSAVVDPARSVTLTSATLRTGETFDYLGSRLNITVQRTVTEPGAFEGVFLTSPFNHREQSMLILTRHLPLPLHEDEFVDAFARDQVGFLSLTKGRALVLFAARTRMELVARKAREAERGLQAHGVQILAQGETGRAEIAERFRSEPGMVVYGLRSFWQGFDAPGETLSYLFIEKAPYPHPGDALVAARSRLIADQGGDPFMDYIVPRTAVLLAQGFGRLIRTETDRGAVLLCDRRLQVPNKANHVLLSTLPGPAVHYADGRDDAWRHALRFVTGEDPDLTEALALAGDEVEAILEQVRLLPGEDPEPKLREAARLLFGIEQLQLEQLELMLAHLRGEDALGVLPTGHGKSLCFQLPAVLRAENRATVVVSPLIALIKDQLDDLRSTRGLKMVKGIDSGTTAAERTDTLRDLAEGRIRLLYVSPERLVRDPWLREALAAQNLAGLVVDEAHCISAWGHDFRPEFRRVSAAVAHLDAAGSRIPRLALTATATEQVTADIVGTLEMRDPVRVVLPPDRPNLQFSVTRVGSERERARELLRVVEAMKDSPGLVYASRRVVTEEVAALLRRAGHSARHYHAGLVPEQREAIQNDFLQGTTQIVVATKAFGMGINKSDIGWVVHYDLPESLEAYVQEAGRAARRRQDVGRCTLLYSRSDVTRRQRHVMDAQEGERLVLAQRLLGHLAGARRRGEDVVFDAEEAAVAIGTEAEQLNVLLAWLERAGALEQKPDCVARGTIGISHREPADPQEKGRYHRFVTARKLMMGVQRRIDFDDLGEDVDLDRLEQDLVSWTLSMYLNFTTTGRYSRVRLIHDRVDQEALAREVRRWQRWQREQLRAMTDYAQLSICRRRSIVSYFGFSAQECADGDQLCDVCGGLPAWHELPDSRVPDPESLIDVNHILLQAVSWSTASEDHRYGETGLKLAVLGNESFPGGVPLGAGLQRCPQFGALRYLRGADRRWDEAVQRQLQEGRLVRETIESRGREYTSLSLTAAGSEAIGGRRG